jgi:hypothetical protein
MATTFDVNGQAVLTTVSNIHARRVPSLGPQLSGRLEVLSWHSKAYLGDLIRHNLRGISFPRGIQARLIVCGWPEKSP